MTIKIIEATAGKPLRFSSTTPGEHRVRTWVGSPFSMTHAYYTTTLAGETVTGLVLPKGTTCKIDHGHWVLPSTKAPSPGFAAESGAVQVKTADVVVPPPDTTAPTITVPGDMTTAATSPTGAVVTFGTPATDDPTATVTCSPVSGSVFPVGSTVVMVTAKDPAGNTSTATFRVTVTAVVVPPPPSTGYPDASNTGVPAGTTLTTRNGPISTTRDGEVIERLKVVGGTITVSHNNVTIRKCLLYRPGYIAIYQTPGVTGLVVEDCEIDGTGIATADAAIVFADYTVRRCNIHHFGEGLSLNGNHTIEDNYLHDFTNFIAQGAHQDGMQAEWGDNILIRHNTIMQNVEGANSCIWFSGQSHANCLVENNLVAGASYAIGLGNQAAAINNRISTAYYPNGGYFGPFTYTSPTMSGNVWHENGLPISTPPPPPPPPSGTMPSRANTGPRYALTNMTPAEFVSAQTADRKRITGDVWLDQSWMKGQTFSLTDCEIAGNIFVMLGTGDPLALSEMAIINMSYVDVTGSIQATSASKFTADHCYINGGQLALKNEWNPWMTGPAPYTFTNSVFHQIWEEGIFHSEALHVAEYGSGYRFTNVAFVIDGGNISVGGFTATINFHATEAVFDGCWFLSDGQPATYNAAAIEGPQVMVKNSAFDDRIASVYQGVGFTDATYVNCKGYPSGAPLALP